MLETRLLAYTDKIYIPKTLDLKMLILDEHHKRPYLGHLGYQKRITILRK